MWLGTDLPAAILHTTLSALLHCIFRSTSHPFLQYQRVAAGSATWKSLRTLWQYDSALWLYDSALGGGPEKSFHRDPNMLSEALFLLCG
jgi:hypothetical protein